MFMQSSDIDTFPNPVLRIYRSATNIEICEVGA